MRKTSFMAATLFAFMLGFSSLSVLAQNRGPSTPEERAKALQLVRALETDPLHKDAKEARRWLTIWLIEVPDISIAVCTGYFEPLYKSDKNYRADITTQMMFSSAAFIIEHPEQAKDDVAVNKAGVEGSLKAYEAILKTKPKAKNPFLDGLIERRDKGTLEEYVRDIATTKCKASKD